MARIVALRAVRSIKVGPGSTVAPDGTIINPVPYDAVNVQFDDGVVVQVERPLTLAKVQDAYRAASAPVVASIDGVTVGADSGPGGPP